MPTPSQKELAAKALRQKREAEAHAPAHPQNTPTPREGPVPVPRPDAPPSGAFDAEGQRPVLERSRKAR